MTDPRILKFIEEVPQNTFSDGGGIGCPFCSGGPRPGGSVPRLSGDEDWTIYWNDVSHDDDCIFIQARQAAGMTTEDFVSTRRKAKR